MRNTVFEVYVDYVLVHCSYTINIENAIVVIDCVCGDVCSVYA